MDIHHSTNYEGRPASLGTQVAERLTKAILEGEFKGGDQLVEQELQARFGVSRSPLREAFRELEKKGLVNILPRRGTFVKRINRKDIREHFPVRAVLEGLAARLAAPIMPSKTKQELKVVLQQMGDAVKRRDTGAYYRYHLVFHELFIDASDNELLISTLQMLRMQSLWHRFSYQYYQESLENSYQVHQLICNLFNEPAPDAVKLGQLVEDHINVAVERFLEYLGTFERDDTSQM